MGNKWTGINKKESVAFAVKTACTVFIVVGVLRGRRCCPSFLADVNSMWRPGSAADWQTVPLQSAANQPVSITRCYRGRNVLPACGAPRLFLPSFRSIP